MDFDLDLMEEILARVDWKCGIRPLGNLATEVCFVQNEMPIIKRLVEKPSNSLLVTQSSWTSHLVDTGILSNLNNDTTMHSLSELHLLFHTRQQQPGHRTLHHLHLDSQAYFSVNHILRPTIKFQRALEEALSHLHVDNERAWQSLCKVWHDFGYLWPEKIILGHRHHVKHNYQVKADSERVYQLQIAKDHTSALLDMELQKSQSKEKTRKSIGSLQITSSHDGHHQESTQDIDYWRQITSSWQVIKRDDARPIYEFLPAPMRDSIHHLIKIFVHRIPINQPFMLRSVSTNGYLSWRSNPKQQRNVNVHQHQQQNSDYNNSSSHSSPLVPNNHNSDLQQKAPVLFSTLPLDEMKSTNSYCVWKFSDNIGLLDLHLSPSRQAHYWTTSGVTKYVRCGSQLYLSPCLPPTLHNKDIILTRSNSTSISPTASSSTSLPLSGADTSVRRRGWDLYVEKAARVRSVEFLDKQHSEHESLQQHQWTVETPDLGLDLDDDFSTDGHLNVDIAIGRQKPILDQEIISLRQILYLCSVYNQIPRATSTQQTKRRSTNNNNNTSQLPPIIIPSPVPPAAAGVMAMFRDISNNDDDDKRAFSHPSANVGQSQSHYKQNKGTINDTTNLLVTSSSSSREPHATNTSGSTLPYYNLHTYTVLPPPLVTTSCITTTTLLPNSLSLSSSPCQQYFNPVLAKEHSLINGPEESYWIIELLSKDEDKRNTLITKGTSTDNRQKQSGKFTNGYSTNHPLPSGSQEPISTKRIGFRATQTMINKGRYATPSPLRLKMVMSSDTLRDDAKEEMLGGSNDEATLRRVQSFSSVHDHAQQHRQYLDRLGDLTDQDVYNGRNSNNNNNNNNNNDTTTETTPIHTGSTLVAVNSVTASSPSSLQQRIIPNGLLHLNATGDIQPYLQLYVAKQNSKTWSHIIKHSTLANIKRWLKTTT